MIKIGINGACGRMGLRLVNLISQRDDVQLVLALERSDHPAQAKDIGIVAGLDSSGVLVTDRITQKNADIILDFSTPQAIMGCLLGCKQYRIALLIGTTSLTKEQENEIKKVSRDIPCLISPNLSRGANLLFQLSREVSKRLDKSVDIEIIETHHRAKKDAPSGTASRLAREIGRVREDKNIPIHSLRIGNVVGEHKVVFGMPGERIELLHRADSRDAFAHGAIEAGCILAKAQPGLYTLDELLNQTNKT